MSDRRVYVQAERVVGSRQNHTSSESGSLRPGHRLSTMVCRPWNQPMPFERRTVRGTGDGLIFDSHEALKQYQREHGWLQEYTGSRDLRLKRILETSACTPIEAHRVVRAMDERTIVRSLALYRRHRSRVV